LHCIFVSQDLYGVFTFFDLGVFNSDDERLVYSALMYLR
jgi:hypothetical protein